MINRMFVALDGTFLIRIQIHVQEQGKKNLAVSVSSGFAPRTEGVHSSHSLKNSP